jgi:excisionase family DNA binding protein
MAGMFFSIQEVAAKLGKSEDEVRQIVKSGRLREFRDGPNLLFKVDEVNSLMADTSFTGVKPADEKPVAPKSEEAEAEEILLAPDMPIKEGEGEELQLTDADTQIVEEGIKVLGDTDSVGKEGSDETFKGLGSGSGSPGKEASLEEIEKDVSLDTFGSGSGLLDLSLQADDTSLGGILDEIYTPGGEGKAPAAAAPAGGEAAGSAMEIAAEADQMQFPEPQMSAPAFAAAMAYAEPEPDAMSNALGVMLFIPIVAVIYTALVAVAGFSNVTPAILKLSQGFIWYIVIGLVVASGIIMAVGSTMGGEKKPKVPKPPKVKKEKPPKPVKEKKGK